MSGPIASKNLYELLGNDPELDPDRSSPSPPVKVVDKTPARNTKRNPAADASTASAPTGDGRGPRRGGYGGNEGAFRDRTAGSASNRDKPTDDGFRSDRPAGRGRGGGGNRGGARFDRHSGTVGRNSEKQAAHGWGATEGQAELQDEQAGEAIAETEATEALTGDGDAPADTAAAKEAEPEDNSMSYADYMAQLEEKRVALGDGIPEARKPNEGNDDKWANAKAVTKEEEQDFFAGTGSKPKRERKPKDKQILEIAYQQVDSSTEQHGDRGDRGGFRGGRGGRGRGGDGFRGRGGGDFRGGGEFRGRGGRGRGGAPARGARGGGSSAPINTDDQSAFPSLGGN